jgi:hypothetical protein
MEGAKAAQIEIGMGGKARRKLPRVDGAQRIHGSVGLSLRFRRIERHGLVPQLLSVFMSAVKQALAEFLIGQIKMHCANRSFGQLQARLTKSSSPCFQAPYVPKRAKAGMDGPRQSRVDMTAHAPLCVSKPNCAPFFLCVRRSNPAARIHER